MKDEAMKLALEAAYLAGFKASGEGYNGEYPFGDRSEHPEQDKNWCAERDDFIKQALAVPVQKMVANMTVEDGRISFAARILADGTYDLYTTPIYAVPFQRKPLTEEDILECWKQAYEPGRREHDNAIRMARAIEAKFKERTQ